MDRGDLDDSRFSLRLGSALLPRILLVSVLLDLRMLGSTLRLRLLGDSMRIDRFPRWDPCPTTMVDMDLGVDGLESRCCGDLGNVSNDLGVSDLDLRCDDPGGFTYVVSILFGRLGVVDLDLRRLGDIDRWLRWLL